MHKPSNVDIGEIERRLREEREQWLSPRGYAPNLHEALRRAEQRRIRVTPRINWTVLAVATTLAFLLGISAIAVPAMLLAGVTL